MSYLSEKEELEKEVRSQELEYKRDALEAETKLRQEQLEVEKRRISLQEQQMNMQLELLKAFTSSKKYMYKINVCLHKTSHWLFMLGWMFHSCKKRSSEVMEVAFNLSKETYQSLVSVNQEVMKNVAQVKVVFVSLIIN